MSISSPRHGHPEAPAVSNRYDYDNARIRIRSGNDGDGDTGIDVAEPSANSKARANANANGNLNGHPGSGTSPSHSSNPSESEDAAHNGTHHDRPPTRDLQPTAVEASEADDDADADADADAEADDVIGVSMGYDQSRLKSRTTPAEEKTRIMERNSRFFEDEGLFGGDITEEPESFNNNEKEKSNEGGAGTGLGIRHERNESAPAARAGAGAGIGKVSAPVSSKEGGAGAGMRSSFTRSLLSTLPLRPRAWSGDSGAGSRLKKFFPSLHLRTGSLSISRHRSPSWSPRRNADQESAGETAQSPRPSVSNPSSAASNKTLTGANHTNGNEVGAPAEDPIGDIRPLQAPSAMTRGKHSFVGSNPTLRRSSSDQSLYLRASSTASSLEHRPQYEHVHSQSNSRFKAIKDTLQDSSSRLLSMPTLHLQDFRSDWGYRQFLSDAHHRRTETDETDDTAGSMGGAPPLEPRALPDDSPRFMPSPRKSLAATYPILYEAINDLTGDVVVMGGYRGSILRSAKPPQRQLWVPMKVGLNLRKVDLEVGLTPEDEERMEDSIIPDGVLSHVGPVDICRRLLKRLQKCDNAVRGDLRVHNYGYDWRLSPHLLSKRLIKYLEGLPCNAPGVPAQKRGAYVIAHSLGGLIARHAVNQRPDLFAGVLYAGVPQHCVNILGPLRNGDDVLLSSKVLTAQVNFTFRTSFALLPEKGHCFINKRTKQEYRLDFFDPAVWDEFRLSPCINPPIPTTQLARSGSTRNMPLRKRFSTILSNSSADDTSLDLDSSSPNTSSDHSPTPTDASGSSTPTTNTNQNPASAAMNALKTNVPAKPKGEIPGPTINPKCSSTSPAAQPVTIPPGVAKEFLTRTLAEVLQFKHETLHNEQHQTENKYPPFAVMFSKSVPTVYGARVNSKEGIKYADAYDDLAFAAGDGVCLASAAMLPAGYRVIKEGMVKSDRGHVGLLGDLEGVGACLRALVKGRKEGVGIEGLSGLSS